MQKWISFSETKTKFVKEEYEPEMLRRTGGPGADVSRQPSVRAAKPPPTLKERIWPEMPATPPRVVKRQFAELARIDKAMKDPGLNFSITLRDP